MSRKKKKQQSNSELQKSVIKAYAPLFSPDFKADLRWWYRNEPKKADKVMDLVADILDGDPFRGIGKPEPLKYIASNTWSRRIDLENRLVYKVKGDYAPRSLRIAFIFYKLVITIKKGIEFNLF